MVQVNADTKGSVQRIEGRDKVTGGAKYAGDLVASSLHMAVDVAVPVVSTQATGRVVSIDDSEVLKSSGARAVITHANAPRLHEVFATNGAEIGELLPLQSDQLHYAGECIALVIADTLDNARAAALQLKVEYSKPKSGAAFTLEQGASRVKDAKSVGAGDKGQVEIGNPEEAYAAAEYKVDLTFESAPHHHNSIEPGAIVAWWDDTGGLTVHLPTQFSYGDAVILGEAFKFGLKDRLPRIVGQVLGGLQFDNKVRVISTLAGGAFGGKNASVYLLLASMAAKLTGRAVKLVLTRQQTFSLMPFRGATQQRMRIAADRDGILQAIIHDAVIAQGAAGKYAEPAGENTTKSYACKNMRVHLQAARLDTNAPGWMRGPGACVNQFALESSLDVLADKLNLDPLEIRLKNHADVEPGTGHEWSSKSLKQCYEAAGRKIGWFDRNPAVGSMRSGRQLVGFGLATSLYPVKQLPAVARIILQKDGHALVQTSVHEIGQGMITAMTQVAAERLGLPVNNVHLEWGDTKLPYGSMTVGSMSMLSNGAAIADAADLVKQSLFKHLVRKDSSPFFGKHRHDLEIVEGRVTSTADGVSEPVTEVVSHLDEPIEEESIAGRTMGHSSYGRYAFGAQFAKVLVDPELKVVQVERMIGAFAGGRAINPMLARSQLIGGMIWGIGQALMEESRNDLRSGAWMNRNLGEALVPTHADVADVDAIVIEEDDTRGHPLGVKGLGEIGVVGTAAAIANAIYHATGQRINSLPIRIDRLL